MRISRFDRLQRLMDSKKLSAAIYTNASTIKCLSGYGYFFETGPSPFHVLPATLFCLRNSESSLLLASDEMNNAANVFPNIKVLSYTGYAYKEPLHFTNDFLNQSLDILEGKISADAIIGIEINSFPYSLYQVLTGQFPGIKFIDITQDIINIRAVKDEDEIDHIRAAAGIADIGQESVLKYAEEGMTELELFSKVRLDMDMLAGKRTPVMTDVLTGHRTATGGGNPSKKVIEKNDLILTDFTPCLNGYWGDSCSTITIGIPTAPEQKDFTLVLKALNEGINAIRPGAVAKDIDQVMRKTLESEGGFEHHGGHGVGTVYHEEPRIVPYNDKIIEPGMVIALEPALYKTDYGIRLEHLILVTVDGNEVLTKFNHRLLK